ncbi:MAG TPA: arginase family protein, partial [Gaiellales bacterium]|nr:arginase family protein [Gaiellales bacterium]
AYADGKPDYAGLLTFGGLPYTEDVADLEGVDVAIIGAPMDELTSDHPGTRFGPRAIRAASAPHGNHLEAGIDAFEALRVVDYGDAAILPSDPAASHAAIRALVAEVAGAGVIPVVLGGDHSIAQPEGEGLAQVHGQIGMIHFDTHTDTATHLWEAKLSHGTPMYWLVEDGHVDPRRYVQIGLRGYWPGEEEFEWQRERGITSFFMHDVRERGISDVVEEAVAIVGDGPVLLTVDVDVLDPAFAPGTGTPEPGGLTPRELLWACRAVGAGVDLVGSDVVEVIPTGYGRTDITALVGDRIVRETLTGVALRRGSTTKGG